MSVELNIRIRVWVEELFLKMGWTYSLTLEHVALKLWSYADVGSCDRRLILVLLDQIST